MCLPGLTTSFLLSLTASFAASFYLNKACAAAFSLATLSTSLSLTTGIDDVDLLRADAPVASLFLNLAMPTAA